MSARVISLDFDRLAVYEAGAVMLTVLAYPQECLGQADGLGFRPLLSLCALAVLMKAEHDPQWAWSNSIKPVYAGRNHRDITRDLKTFQRRQRDRMAAGKIGVAFLKEAQTGQIPDLPADVKRMSLNELAKMGATDAGYTNLENFETRVWRPCLPVIHLAAAFQIVMNELKRLTERQPNFVDYLCNRRLIECTVDVANECKVLLAKSRYASVDPEALINLEVVRG
jgi:hypothetical protein